MPPKRGKTNAGKRGDDTQRVPNDTHAPATTAGSVAAAAPTATAAARLPHHLLSRTHPRWNAPASTNGAHPAPHSSGTSSSTTASPPPPHTPAKHLGVSAGKHNTAAPRPRGAMPTRVAGKGAATIKGDAKSAVAASTRKPSTPTTGTAFNSAAAVVGRKRSRSQSASNPIEVDGRADKGESEMEETEVSDETDQTDGTASEESAVSSSASTASSSSVSLSPQPMVAESRVLHTSGGSNSGSTGLSSKMKEASEVASAEPATSSTEETSEEHVGVSAEAEAKAAAAAALPSDTAKANTSTSTGESKVLLEDDEVNNSDDKEKGGNEGSATQDEIVWSTQRDAGAEGRQPVTTTQNDSISPLPDRMLETHVLGELSDRTSVTPARPQRAAPTKVNEEPHQTDREGGENMKNAPHSPTVAAGGLENDTDEGELLGNLPPSSKAAAATREAYQSASERHQRFQQLIGEEAENPTASTGSATPSLVPSRDSGSPGDENLLPSLPASVQTATGGYTAAADTAISFAETLAVQDIPLLTGETNTAFTEEQEALLPVLASSMDMHTPRGGPATDSADRSPVSLLGGGDGDGRGEGRRNQPPQPDREMLLGDGLVSPPVKRATATPQQAQQGAAAAAVGESATGALVPGQRELHPPPPLFGKLDASSTPDSSLFTPHSTTNAETRTKAAATRDANEGKASQPSSASSTPSTRDSSHSPPQPAHVSSLPSTLDDGCWKEDEEQTPLRTPPSSLPVAASTHAHREMLEKVKEQFADDAAANAYPPQQETVPIDPFLETPPQLRRGRGGAQPRPQHTEVLSEDSDGTPERITTTVKKAKSGSPKRSRRSTSKSLTPPRDTARQTTTKHDTNTEIDSRLLKIGTQVEGRWGRQWFPATVVEAPRNGFVQIAWTMDGALLHVRLREVRLPADAQAASAALLETENSNSATAEKKKGLAIPTSGRTAHHGETKNPEEESVLTATQLVRLMEEEDAEDSRHEVEHSHSSNSRPTAPPTAPKVTSIKFASAPAAIDGEIEDDKNKNEEEEEVCLLDKEETAGRGGPRRRKRSASSTPPLPTQIPPAASSAMLSTPRASVLEETTIPHAVEGAKADTSKQTAASAAFVDTLPLETAPSSLCIYLAPTVRRALLQGDCPATATSSATAAATEVQRNTELQRILHFLSSAGATLISSLAQADNVAAQLGDNESPGTGFGTRPPPGGGGTGVSSVAVHRQTPMKERSTSMPKANEGQNNSNNSSTVVGGDGVGGGGGGAGGVRRKTVGRVPLPRRSATQLAPSAATPRSSQKYFLFLVADVEANSNAAESTTVDHLPDVCVAHAFGVSAIRASWLWSVVPGALHVRLPTTFEQISLSTSGMTYGAKHGKCAHVVRETVLVSPPPPLRLTPFPSHERWLSGKAVQFVERDDAVEMWLNAAGAVVTAEVSAPPPQPVLPSSAPQESPQMNDTTNPGASVVKVEQDADSSAVASVGAGRSRSVSLTRHTRSQQPPPRKQPCLEKRPDYVYVRDDAASAPVDLSRLGDVPVLRLSWLIRGVERHYGRRCRDVTCGEGGGGSRSSIAHHTEDDDAEEEAPPPFSTVWRELQCARAANAAAQRSRSRRERSTTPTVREASMRSPLGPVNAEGAGGGVEEEEVVVHADASPGAAVDGNTKVFEMRSPDARMPTSHLNNSTPMRATGGRRLPIPTAALQPQDTSIKAGLVKRDAQDASELHDGNNNEKNTGFTKDAKQKANKTLAALAHATGTEEKNVLAASLPDPQFSATPRQPVMPTAATAAVVEDTTAASFVACTHEPAAVGGDYYFSIDMPSAATLSAAARQLQPTPSPQQVMPAATIALGRVVALHPNTEGIVVTQNGNLVSSYQGNGAPLLTGWPSPPPPCCFAVLQLYQPKYVSMHVDPRSGGVVHQTTVYLSPQLVTVPTSALFFDIPVYVVSPAARQHVYLLEEEDEANERQGASGDSSDTAHTTAQRGVANTREHRHPSPVQNDFTPVEKATTTTADVTPGGTDVHLAEERSPSSSAAVMARHAMHGSREAPQPSQPSPRRISLGSAPRAARMLAQLPVELSGRAVVLHPGSHVTFYTRRSLSLSERRTSQVHRADSPSDFPLASETKRERVGRRTRGGSPHPKRATNDADTSGDSDSSEELIAEAPLVGQVELMREMDGSVDIVVHTAQPNSVFGGSKMYRVTPDMIVDAAP